MDCKDESGTLLGVGLFLLLIIGPYLAITKLFWIGSFLTFIGLVLVIWGSILMDKCEKSNGPKPS